MMNRKHIRHELSRHAVRHKRIVLLLCAFTSLSLCGADWLQFRGNDTNGITLDKNLPTALSGETVRWKVELPGRGLAGPIVIGDRVVTTASSGYRQDRLHILCFDQDSGQQLWNRQFWATGRTSCHQKMCVATPTPASDGERIFAFYSSNDLICLDLEGNLLWYRGLGEEFPNASNSLGMSSSPLVVGDVVMVQVESDAEAFAIALDTKTGAERWRMDRPHQANWTSPAVMRGAGADSDLALLQSSAGLDIVDPQTGNVVWSYEDGAATIPSSTPVGRRVYVPSNGLTVLEANENQSAFNLAWNDNKLSPRTSSPLVYEGRVYTVSGSVLKCADAETGKIVWQLRLEGSFSSTPVAGSRHLYLFSEDGFGFVIDPNGRRGEIVSRMDFGDTILCTPAVASDSIYVRSDDHLWKLANAPE